MGQRMRPQFMYNGHTFFQSKIHNKISYWQCTKTKKLKCSARLSINLKTEEIIYTKTVHNHVQFPVKQIHVTSRLKDILERA